MGRLKDLTGQKLNHLTAQYRGDNAKDGHAQWWCLCDCGNPNLVLVRGVHLTNGNTTSCGCAQKENARQHCIKAFKKYNHYDLETYDYGVGYTSKGEEFWFDKEDYDLIKDYYWYVNEEGYIRTNVSNKYHFGLSRLVMQCPDKYVVDHIHGKDTRFDNRKSNLRVCTQSNNCMNRNIRFDNTSGCTGVNWHENYQKWQVRIGVGMERIEVGFYDLYEEAVAARKAAEEKYYGEYSYDNSQKY